MTYAGAKYLGLSPELARPPGFIVATVVNFLLNRAITFRHSEAPLVRAFLRYCAVASAGLAVNYAVYSACVLLAPRFGIAGDAGDPACLRRRRLRRRDDPDLPRLPLLRLSLMRAPEPLPKDRSAGMMPANARAEEPDVPVVLRTRSRSQRRQFPAAHAAELSRARGGGVPRPAGDRAWAPQAQLPRLPRPVEKARLGAGEARHSRAATRSRSCSPIRPRCSNATMACRCAARCSIPSTPASTRRRSPSCSTTARPGR